MAMISTKLMGVHRAETWEEEEGLQEQDGKGSRTGNTFSTLKDHFCRVDFYYRTVNILVHFYPTELRNENEK
jgi:hypothetical protein